MPINTRAQELVPTTKKGKLKPICLVASPPTTAVSAMDPPGGCRHRSTDIAASDSPTESPAAIGSEGAALTVITPTRAETTLPPMMAQGCASGLLGIANRRSADAPMGAINITGSALLESMAQIDATRKMAPALLMIATSLSYDVLPARRGRAVARRVRTMDAANAPIASSGGGGRLNLRLSTRTRSRSWIGLAD